MLVDGQSARRCGRACLGRPGWAGEKDCQGGAVRRFAHLGMNGPRFLSLISPSPIRTRMRLGGNLGSS